MRHMETIFNRARGPPIHVGAVMLMM